MSANQSFKLPPLANVGEFGQEEKPKSQSVKNADMGSSSNFFGSKDKLMKIVNSPFGVPTDEEIFQFYEMEKMKKNESRNSIVNAKIWDKKTFGQRFSLRHYKDFRPEEGEEDMKSKTSFNSHQKKTITAALGVAKERIENYGNQEKKESLIDIISQRKEMFLVTMSHDIIKEEISRIQQNKEDRVQALVDSEKMLKQDQDNFQKYLDMNKQQRLDAEQNAEAVNRQKKQKEMMIKDINLKLTTIRAEKARNEETLQNYKEHKEFLDKLAPKEWEEEKQQKKKALIEDLRMQFFDKNTDASSSNDKASKDPQKSKKEAQSKGRKSISVQKVESLFQQVLESGHVPQLEEFEDNYPMYFQSPDQLQDVFNTLEEKNLFLIQMKQEDEQNIEEMKLVQKNEKQMLNGKAKLLQQQKDLLKKQIEDVSEHVKTIKQLSEETTNQSDLANEKKFSALIVDLYNEFKEEINIHDPESQPPLFVLSQIEIMFEKLFKEIKVCPIAIVEQKRKKAEKDRKQISRDAENKRKKDDLERRNEKNRIKMTQTTQKKTGRIDMGRSAPLSNLGMKEVEEENNQVDEDQKYFRENYELL